MKKMTALRTHLANLGCFNAGALEAWVEDMTLKSRGKKHGEAVLLHTLRYQAVFAIDQYPYKRHPVEMFNAALMTWLAEHDDRSELDNSDPDIGVDVFDDDTAGLELSLSFEEDVFIIPDEQGMIEFLGERWSLQDPELWIAESGELDSRTTDG